MTHQGSLRVGGLRIGGVGRKRRKAADGGPGPAPVFVASASGLGTAGTINVSGTVMNGSVIVAANCESSIDSYQTPTAGGISMSPIGTAISTDGAGSVSKLWALDLSSHSGSLAITNLRTNASPAYHIGLFENVAPTSIDVIESSYTGSEYVAASRTIGGTVSTVQNGLVFLTAAHGQAGASTGTGAGTSMESQNPLSAVMRTSYGIGDGSSFDAFQTFDFGTYRASAIAAAFQTI